MINEIITQAIMRFAFEAEQLREAISYRQACNFRVLSLADNFFFPLLLAAGSFCVYSEKHQLKDSSSSYYMESHKELSVRHMFRSGLLSLFLSGKVHSYRVFLI